MSLNIVNNGDPGLSARSKINAAITAINNGTLIGPTGPTGSIANGSVVNDNDGLTILDPNSKVLSNGYTAVLDFSSCFPVMPTEFSVGSGFYVGGPWDGNDGNTQEAHLAISWDSENNRNVFYGDGSQLVNINGGSGSIGPTGATGSDGLTGATGPTNIVSPPLGLTGSLGDMEGQVAYDNNYMYFCTQSYTGILTTTLNVYLFRYGNTIYATYDPTQQLVTNDWILVSALDSDNQNIPITQGTTVIPEYINELGSIFGFTNTFGSTPSSVVISAPATYSTIWKRTPMGEKAPNSGSLLLSKFTMDFNPSQISLDNIIIDYTNLVGSFQVGETISNGTGATATIITDDGGSEMTINNIIGTGFNNGDNITGSTSNATATIDTITTTQPNDQTITLNGGNRFIITDVVITNSSTNINTAQGFIINNGTFRSGNTICSSNVHSNTDTSLSQLQSSEYFVNSNENLRVSGSDLQRLNLNPNGISVGNTLYASLTISQGTTSTCDVYIYGYILY